MDRQEVYNFIDVERNYQDEKWGINKYQTIEGYLLIIESELNEAKNGWIKNKEGRDSTLAEIKQIAAVCVACMEAYGVEGNC